MPSFEHEKIINYIKKLDEVPVDSTAFTQWVTAKAHVDFLKATAKADEMIVYASGPYTFIHSLVVPLAALNPINHDDLFAWGTNPYTSAASYVYGGDPRTMWIERGGRSRGSKTLEAGTDLIYARTFEGWAGPEKTYVEAAQEYTHLAGLHFRPEESAYCRYDDVGDLYYGISITRSGDEKGGVSLVSFAWEELEQYLVLSDSALVRLFDFTLLRYEEFDRWPDDPENVIHESATLFFRQRIAGRAGYTRGVQIILPRLSKQEVADNIAEGWSGRRNKRYVEFIAYDFRSKKVTKISTDPKATTNYFEADGNSLPFELSPAFFRPEVLSKYKTDRDKYTIDDRDIHCRAAWTLRGYDVNKAGQVHAYICDIRALPYEEQLHWLSFNVEPKTGISERAVTTDFKGEFTTIVSARQELASLTRRWADKGPNWWMLRDGGLLDRANVPLTTSTDEWSEAIMDLDKLVVEGFAVKGIRAKLDAEKIAYDPNEQSIALLERLVGRTAAPSKPPPLVGLRAVHHIRSKTKGHVAGSEGKALARQAITTHKSYANHFEHLCKQLVADLKTIESAFGV